MIDVIDVAVVDKDSEDVRWRRWQQQGRVDDARFRRNLKTVLVDVIGVVALGGAVWFALENLL
jgi:hypothetical protein